MTQADRYRRLGHVLVATDFTQGATWALERALRLPLAPGATLELIHVVPGESAAIPDRAGAEARAQLERLVADARAQLGPRELRVSSSLAAGQPHVEIIRRSRQVGAELVIVGRHGSRTFRHRLLGPIAARVVRKGDVPVLVVNLAPTGAYRTPVIASDLQDASSRTVEICLRVLGPDVRRIDVVHALHVPFEGFVRPTADARGDYRTAFEADARTRLDALLASYAPASADWHPIIRAGDARTVLLEVVLAEGADLIAVGTHGRAGISHALLGSVAESVLLNAPCDVLIARPVRFQYEPP